MSSHGTRQSGIDLWTFITSGLLCDPVCQAGDWGSVRSWPRSLLAGRGPDGADDRTPVEVAGKENHVFAVDGRCLLIRIRESPKSQPHGVQNIKRPRHRSQNSRVQRGHLAGELFVHCHPNYLQNNLHPRSQNTFSPRRCRHHPSKSTANNAKGGSVRYAKIMQLGVVGPRVGAVEVVALPVPSIRRRGRAAPTQTTSSMTGVRGALVGLSDAIRRARRIS